ncbi:MAG: hypothetical protein IRY87_10545 [Acetobacteraceae bacterium]|nr:hypothetical protein [Acetobacteraceae bacterium]
MATTISSGPRNDVAGGMESSHPGLVVITRRLIEAHDFTTIAAEADRPDAAQCGDAGLHQLAA